MGRYRVAFLISATGGGHLAAAKAVAAGLEELIPGRFEFLFVDVFREFFGLPLRRAPEIYARWVSLSKRSYGLAFLASDALYRLRFARDGLQRRLGARFLRALGADLVVGIHALLVPPAAAGRERLGLDFPLAAVVTDFARPHAAWFHSGVDLFLAPGPGVAPRARALGIPEGKVVEVGLLVHPRFARFSLPKAAAREALGLDPEAPVVLFLGGGEGMGRLAATVAAVDAALRGVQLLVVCGRNERLRRALEGRRWRNRTLVTGFVERLELPMGAADILVTKAGPLSIAEGLTMGLPLVIYDAIPYQETDNARWVERAGAGIFAPRPRAAAAAIARWLADPAELSSRAETARALASPDSALRAARALAGLLPGGGG